MQWTKRREQAAIMLARGYTIRETAQDIGVTERQIYRWKNDVEFSAEVDRLSCMVDIAGRAERLRMAMRVVRRKCEESDKDLLDWLKFAQSETDGIKLDLASLVEAAASVAGGGPAGHDESQQQHELVVAADPEEPATDSI